MDGSASRTVATGDDEAKIGMRVRERPERAHEMREVLAGLEGGDREHERRVAHHVAHRGGHRCFGPQPGDTERDDVEAARRAQAGPEDLLDLRRDELGAGVHRHAAGNGASTSGTSACTSGVHNSG